MRAFRSFPIGPDVLTLSAVVALAAIVYLCSLPATFQSLSHRKAGAAELMGQAREHVVKEGSLFSALVHVSDDSAAAKLRQQLVDNERGFHEAASEISSELPEAKSEIDTMVTRFDHLAAAGWQAAALAPQSLPEARDDLLNGAFAQALEELRDQSSKMELSLHAHDATYRVETPIFAKAVTISI
jgi:hypothetical protein